MDDRLCFLTDRGVIELAGPDAGGFLQRLVTNSVLNIPKGEARYAALLTPQGKLLFDFFVIPRPDGPEAGYLIDCDKGQADDLVKRLNAYKLRANITIEDKSDSLGVAALLDGGAPAGVEGIVYRDARAAGMGLRMIAPRDALARLQDTAEAAYEAHRIKLGVPRGGADFDYGEAFVHDANLDLLNGVDFKKGCYVGQEVTARVHHRNSARKRILKVHFDGAAPAPGTQIMAGGATIGEIGSACGSEGLAMLRLDKLEEALAAGAELKASDMKVHVSAPD
jgi:folate-binding protein YgfZ